MAEYQTDNDMAFVIRLALAQHADVVTNARVKAVAAGDIGLETEVEDRATVRASRIIDARGLGDPTGENTANGSTILTFPQFLQRMAAPWPLRGINRAAVVGGGDAGKCTVESLLGVGPQPVMAAAALDSLDSIDWYAEDLPATCAAWQQDVRGRYQAIGRYLRSDRRGVRRLKVIDRQAQPVALPGMGLIAGRSYDLVVLCTGTRETLIEGLELGSFNSYTLADGTAVAQAHRSLPVFRVGPHARLPFTLQERRDGIADIEANAVSMFRTATKTAALAATLDRATPA
jgi:hypothetical protein